MPHLLLWPLAGLLLRFVVSLHPVAWLAWVVPALLLWGAFSSRDGRWRVGVPLACAIGYQATATYYFTVMSVAGGVAAIVAQSLLWLFVIAESRRVLRRWGHAWTALAYPVFWVAVDTLLAAGFPDGNWGSLAYTQADVLPLTQTASLFGVAGVLFLLCLVPSAVATMVAIGWRQRSGQVMLVASIVLVAAAVTFGSLRLRHSPTGPQVQVGLAAIDDAIGLQARTPYVRDIQAAYDDHAAALAAAGAHIVVLPEKIAVATEADAAGWADRLAAAAGRGRVWLLAGVAVSTAAGIGNEAWLFAPDGRIDAKYLKQKLAPPARLRIWHHAVAA